VVQTLLQHGADVAAKDKGGKTALDLAENRATHHRCKEEVKTALREHGAKHSLFYAAERGMVELVADLIEEGADVNEKKHFTLETTYTGKAGQTPLDFAWNDEVKTALREHGAKHSLFYAAGRAMVELVADLIEEGADVNEKNHDGYTSLHLASSSSRHVAVVQMLLQHGADVTARNKDGNTSLHLASSSGHAAVVQTLLQHGADVAARNEAGKTPLDFARHDEVKAVFVRHFTPSFFSFSWRLTWAMEQMGAWMQTQMGAWMPWLFVVLLSVYLYAQMQYTPLHEAADKGHKAVTRALVEARADVNARDWMHSTPLHAAARNGHEAVARVLVEGRADVNAKALMQYTPLHAAARNGHEAMTRLLVGAGADVNAKDYWGKTPLDVATNRGHAGVMKLLQKTPATMVKSIGLAAGAAVTSTVGYGLYWLLTQGD